MQYTVLNSKRQRLIFIDPFNMFKVLGDKEMSSSLQAGVFPCPKN